MAAVLLATSCSKDDGNDAAIDTPIDNPQQTVSNAYKTVTISGKVGKATLSKVTVADSKLQLEVGDKFTFGEKDKTDVFGDITINDADGNFTATLNYSTVEVLMSGKYTATLGDKPEGISTNYDNLETAVKNAYYEIPFKVANDGDEEGKFKLTDGTLSKAVPEPTYDIKVYVQAAFIRAQASRSIKLGGSDVNVEINKYYVVPADVQMGSNESNKTSAGKVYNVKKLAGGISYAKTYVGKKVGNDAFTNPLSLTGDGTVTYTSGNAEVATISDDGVVSLGAAGKTTITATVSADTDGFTYADDANTATYTLVVAPVDCIPGIFSVSASKQVFFSKGNLQYQVGSSPAAWRFAEHQYSVCHKTDDNVGDNYSSWSNKWTDLFGWVGKTSNFTDVAQYGVSTSTSTNSADGYGTSETDALKADWGKVFGATSPWQTLTGGDTESAEWYYLFNSRTEASSKYGEGSVNGMKGLILLPDDWTYPTDLSESSTSADNFKSGTSSWSNNYTADDWLKMEANGAVFLPAAGYRYGADVYDVGVYGCSWSSSPSAGIAGSAWSLYFYSGRLCPDDNDYRGFGRSVRLVRPL